MYCCCVWEETEKKIREYFAPVVHTPAFRELPAPRPIHLTRLLLIAKYAVATGTRVSSGGVELLWLVSRVEESVPICERGQLCAHANCKRSSKRGQTMISSARQAE